MTVKTVPSTVTLSERLNTALALPKGARFYRCALQVNPFAYLARHNKPTTFQSEEEYNAAIVDACRETGIEVIGVTDHYRVDESKGLVKAARAAGLFAFCGFEARNEGRRALSLLVRSRQRRHAGTVHWRMRRSR